MAPSAPSPSFPSLLVLLLTILTIALGASGAASPPQQPGSSAAAPPPAVVHHDSHHHITLLAPILANLGFQELAMAIPAVAPAMLLSAWSGPVTLFAPTDDSIRSCLTCSPALLLREHLIPGLFSYHYLSMLSFGTKLETSSPGRCLTVTSDAAAAAATGSKKKNASSGDYVNVKIFVDGIEVTQPDLFNDGRIIIHGIQGFVTPLSPLSCNQDEETAVIGGVGTGVIGPHHFLPQDASGMSVVTRLMLRDAIVRLRDAGFSILALAMRIKYAELVTLSNMTIFALDDAAIFAGGHSYVTSVRFHVVPDRLLTHADLMKLPAGTTLPTLVHGQDLVVTHSGNGNTGGNSVDLFGLGLRINYVPIKRPDIIFNVKIAVHSIFLPFPHLQPADIAWASSAAASAGATPEEGTANSGSVRPSAAPPARWTTLPHDGL